MISADVRDEAIRARKDHRVSMAWCDRYQKGDPAAGNVLVIAHQPLVMSIAARRCPVGSRDWEDCVQAGCLGILDAARTFVPERGDVRTHLWTWIRMRTSREAVRTSQIVSLPVHFFSRRKGEARARASTWRANTTTFTEMLPEEGVENGVVFEKTLRTEGGLAEELLVDVDHEAACARLAAWLLWQIPARERRILQRRFAEEPETLEEIGSSLGITRERTRQLEDRALDLCWGVAPPDAGETFDAWIARALAVKAEREAQEFAA